MIIFGSKRKEIAQEWRKLRSEELCHALHSSHNFIMVIKLRTLEEIKSRLNSENACCHSVQSLVFPYPL